MKLADVKTHADAAQYLRDLEGWHHSTDDHAPGSIFGFWHDGALWSGYVAESDHKALRVKLTNILPAVIK
jgi:hypothetical protein